MIRGVPAGLPGQALPRQPAAPPPALLRRPGLCLLQPRGGRRPRRPGLRRAGQGPAADALVGRRRDLGV
jgi:hypothetical protein